MQQIQWEEIKTNHGGSLFRTGVPGGWLVKQAYSEDFHISNISGTQKMQNVSICFVPDRLDAWQPAQDIHS